MTTNSVPTADQMADFTAWRSIGLDRQPYMASTLFALRVINAPGLGTFAVDDNHRLYIDFDAVTEKGPRWCGEALLHECSHVLAAHATFAKDLGIGPAQHQAWNLAGDMAINDDLVVAGCKTIEGDGMLPKHIGEAEFQTPHHYFSKIMELQQAQQAKQQAQNAQQNGGGSSSDSQPQQGTNQQASKGQPSDQSGPFKGCGSGSGGQAAPCELPSNDDMGGHAPAATEAEKARVRIATATAIKEHAKSRGTVPAGYAEIADQVLAPSKTPWQQVLSSHIRRAVAAKAGAFDTDRNKRNRRRHRLELVDASGTSRGRVVVPGTYQPTPTIEVIRDTSGSMSADDLAVVMREIEAIARRIGVRGDQLLVTDVDAAVHESRAYKGRASVEEVHGRGGTDMTVGIEAAQQRRKNRPTAIVVITDGYTPWPAERGPVPVIAAIVGTETSTSAAIEMFHVPDHIKTIVLDPAA